MLSLAPNSISTRTLKAAMAAAERASLSLQPTWSSTYPLMLADQLPASGFFLGLASHNLSPSSIQAFNDTTYFPPQHANPTTVNSGIAGLIGANGAGDALCDSCDYLKWGAWVADVNFNDYAGQSDQTHPTDIAIAGWWVAGDIPRFQLPDQGFATYDGHTIGNVAALMPGQGGPAWKQFIATGDVHMGWDFSKRSGWLHISALSGRN